MWLCGTLCINCQENRYEAGILIFNLSVRLPLRNEFVVREVYRTTVVCMHNVMIAQCYDC